MTPILLLLAISVDTPATDTSAALVVSERLGRVIDSDERHRYHLFPGIAGFDSAAFQQVSDGRRQAVVWRTPDKVERYPVSARQLQRIGYFVDHYAEFVPELAALPDGREAYRDIWRGISDWQQDSAALVARYGLLGPGKEERTNRVVNAVSGAACGIGLGSVAGTAAGTRYTGPRPESAWVSTGCTSGFWEHYLVHVYELDYRIWDAGLATGLAAGGGAGWWLGSKPDRDAARRSRLAALDFFGEPINETEVRLKMGTDQRAACTFLAGLGGGVAGAGLGLLASVVVRSIVLQDHYHDYVDLGRMGIAFDLPIVALAIAGTVQAGYGGWRLGERLDREAALNAIQRARVQRVP